MRTLLLVLTLSLWGCQFSFGKQCYSIAASSYGGWKPAKFAPHDGTVVEMMETYGVAPWYGLFKWTKDHISVWGNGPDKGKKTHFDAAPSWVGVSDPESGVDEDECLFWRPYKSSGKYVDPTNGAQRSIAYWCLAVHRPYDPKTNLCK